MTSPILGNFIGWCLWWVYGRRAALYFRGGTLCLVNRIIPRWAVGQTWGDRIFILGSVYDDYATDKSENYIGIREHEYVHVEQWRRLGFWGLGFIVAYLWESIRHGYENNAFEIEARKLSEGK